MTQPTWRRALHLIGPWPLRPVLEFFVIFFISLLISSGTMIALRGASLLKAGFATTVPSLLAAGVMAGVLWLGKRLASPLVEKFLLPYLLITILAALLGILARAAFTHLPFSPNPDDLALIPFATFRYSAWILTTQGLAGYAIQRIDRQRLQLQDALEESRGQQSRMLIAEERSRRQISVLLHDRVQAGLITACLELQTLQGLDRDNAHRVRAIIERLESLRALDVRGAARALSPDLAAVDIHSALQDLARLYEPGMSTRISIDPAITTSADELPSDTLLAAYRIAEQGLLNAAVHGRATLCELRLEQTTDHHLLVAVTDNGVGMGAQAAAPGFGSAIITTWTRVLGGTWEWHSAQPTGTCLAARLPLAPADPMALRDRGSDTSSVTP